MTYRFHDTHSTKEHRLLREDGQAEMPAQVPDASEAQVVPEMAMENFANVQKEMDDRVQKTYEMMHHNWGVQIDMLVKQRDDLQFLVRREDGRANEHRTNTSRMARRFGALRPELRGSVGADFGAQGMMEMQLGQKARAEQYKNVATIDALNRRIDLLRTREPTLADAARVVSAGGGVVDGAMMLPTAPGASAVYTERFPGTMNTVPGETPFQTFEGAMQSAFDQFGVTVGPEKAIELAQAVEAALKANPALAQAIPTYITLLETNATVTQEALKTLPPEEQQKILALQAALGANAPLFEQFLKAYGPTLKTARFENGSLKATYSLKDEPDQAKKQNILAILEMRKEATTKGGQNALLERIDGKLMMDGVDIDSSKLDGTNPETEVKMLPQESTQRFFAFFMGLMKWVQSFGMKNENKEAAAEPGVEKPLDKMTVEELTAKKVANEKRIGEIPKEKDALQKEIETDKKKIEEAEKADDKDTPDAQKKITEMKESLKAKEEKMKALDEELKKLQEEQSKIDAELLKKQAEKKEAQPNMAETAKTKLREFAPKFPKMYNDNGGYLLDAMDQKLVEFCEKNPEKFVEYITIESRTDGVVLTFDCSLLAKESGTEQSKILQYLDTTFGEKIQKVAGNEALRSTKPMDEKTLTEFLGQTTK